MSTAMSALLPSRNSSEETAFAYKPLSAEADTRIIELEPAPDASFPLRCRIADLCLSSKDLVEYEALSYTWGAPDFTETLHVVKDEDKTSVIKITTNLRNALQRIRLENQKRLLWVDAVCINQQDDSDKSKQIPAMAHIFSAASRVLVWLGTSAHGQIALANIKKNLRIRSTGSKKLEAHFSSLESSFHALVVLPWFRRRWIIQEVVLAADVTVMCGREEISLIHLFRALGDFMRESKVPPVLAPLAAISRLWKTWVLDSNPESGLRLFELLSLFHESDCQVDLDRIYALCNLASDCVVVDKEGEVETDKISVLVDYSQTADCLYQSVVDQILRLEAHDDEITEDVRGHYEVRGPDVETYREVFGAIVERCDGSSRNVTAWVPDWRLPERREPIFKSLDFHFDVYEKRELFSSLIHPVGRSSYNRLKVVSSVLRPFPEHPNMAEVKNWLQVMRNGFAYYQEHYRLDLFLSQQSEESSDFLMENSFLNHARTRMSLDCVWCAFLFAILRRGTWWHPISGGGDAVKDNAMNLYLLSLGESEVQVSPELWSFLCSLFRGRRIFSCRVDGDMRDMVWGTGIGPDHLKADAFIISSYELRGGMHSGCHALLWDAVTQHTSTLVGDAWVLPWFQ